MASVNIKGLSQAMVVAALYNAARPINRFWVVYPPITTAEITEIMEMYGISERNCFDFKTRFRVRIKIDQNTVSSIFYDTIVGQGAMRAIINDLYKHNDPNSRLIQDINESGYYDLVAFLDHNGDEAYGT